YEARMMAEERRLDYFDEQNRVFGDPLDMLLGADGEPLPVDIFFRPPKGIRRTGEVNPAFAPFTRFPQSLFTGAFAEVYVCVSAKKLDDFRVDVLRVFP